MAQIEPTELAGDEVEVFFVPGQVFSGVAETWIRPRLRLDPAVGLLDLEQEALWIVLDGEVLEDFELDCVLGSGPHDGDLVSVQGPGDSGASAAVRGGWLETVVPDISHEVMWIGATRDLGVVARACVIGWLATWDSVEVTYDRVGAWDDLSSVPDDPAMPLG